MEHGRDTGQGSRRARTPRGKHAKSSRDEEREGRESRGEIGGGSSTERVVLERRSYGPWQTPNYEDQISLVERLANPKPVPPNDPQFDAWVNHFEQYWATSCDGQRPRPRSSAGPTPEKRSEVKRRPQTTSGRQDTSPQRRPNTSPQGRPNASPQGHPDTSPQGRPNASPQGQPGTTQGRPVTSHEGRSKSPTTRMRGRSQTRQESRGRYLSCQRVTSAQLQEIVTRLTRDTTAHKVKCAPNPHVWVDTSPGAHMVRRRQQAVTSQ